MNKKIPTALFIAILLVIGIGLCLIFYHFHQILTRDSLSTIITFNPPTINIGNENEELENQQIKKDLILQTPLPNQTISSPLIISGQARGSWFFEASFPVFLVDWDGRIIAQGVAQAKSDWMTTGFVPFEATLTFTVDKNVYSNRGALILKKDNPSGLPDNDDSLEIPVIISEGAVLTPTN